jgi:NhaA family Na+:H+ antiporter
MEDLSQGTEAPLERLERALLNWVGFLIVPIFALANAGVHISGDVASAAIESPISQGVALGLVLGKPVGIFLFTFVAVKLGLCDMPRGANWLQILAVGMIAGIGFTVALLIAALGFDSPVLIDEAKLGILSASIVAGVAGLVFLFFATQQQPAEDVLVEQRT